MFRDGVTAVGDICNGTSTFPLKRKSPVLYHNFVECFGLRAQDFTPMRTVLRECTGSGLEGSLTPHSTYSLQDAPFRAVAAESHRLSVPFYGKAAPKRSCIGPGDLCTSATSASA